MSLQTKAAAFTFKRQESEVHEGRTQYAHLIGLKETDPLSLAGKVESGLDFQAFVRLQREVQLTTARLAELISMTNRTLARRKRAGRLKPTESDRLLRVARIFQLALALFEGERSPAQSWLETPNPALNAKTPLELSKTEIGAREVENLVQRLEHGVFA